MTRLALMLLLPSIAFADSYQIEPDILPAAQ